MDDVHFLRTHAPSVDREFVLDSTRATRHESVDDVPFYRFAVPDTHLVVQVTLVRAFVPSNPWNVRAYAASLAYYQENGTRTVLTLPPGRYDHPSALAPYLSPAFTYDAVSERWTTTHASNVRFEAGENSPRLCVLLGLPTYETWVGRVFPRRGTLAAVVGAAEVEYAAIRVIGHASETAVPVGAVYQAHVLPRRVFRHPVGVVTHFDVAMCDRYGDPYDTDGCPFWMVLHVRVLSLQDVRIRAETFRTSIAPEGYVPHAGLYAQNDDEYDDDDDSDSS